jgi:hypothetical protein
VGDGGERKEGDEDEDEDEEDEEVRERVSDSLLLLLFDGENMCPICLQRFEARTQRHQQQLQHRVTMLKAASAPSDADRQDGNTGASSSSWLSSGMNLTPGAVKWGISGTGGTGSAITPVTPAQWEGSDDFGTPLENAEEAAAADTVWAFSALAEACHLIRERDDEERGRRSRSSANGLGQGEEDKIGALDQESHEPEPEPEPEPEQESGDWQALLARCGNEEVDLADTPVMLACGHVYHTKCIRSWTSLSNSCPVCRCHVEEGDILWEAG